MTTEFTLQAIHAHVIPIQQTSLFGFWRSAIHAKILTHFFTLTTKTTNKMPSYYFELENIELRADYMEGVTASGENAEPTAHVVSVNWNGMDVQALMVAWIGKSVNELEEDIQATL
jgi:hypothetical protein